MKFAWDDAKRKANVRKHGIDFADVQSIFAGYAITLPDKRLDYEEDRFITFGLVQGVVLAVAHTEETETIRIISARKATKREEEAYFSAIQD